jgi:hypothetical protein
MSYIGTTEGTSQAKTKVTLAQCRTIDYCKH